MHVQCRVLLHRTNAIPTVIAADETPCDFNDNDDDNCHTIHLIYIRPSELYGIVTCDLTKYHREVGVPLAVCRYRTRSACSVDELDGLIAFFFLTTDR